MLFELPSENTEAFVLPSVSRCVKAPLKNKVFPVVLMMWSVASAAAPPQINLKDRPALGVGSVTVVFCILYKYLSDQ